MVLLLLLLLVVLLLLLSALVLLELVLFLRLPVLAESSIVVTGLGLRYACALLLGMGQKAGVSLFEECEKKSWPWTCTALGSFQPSRGLSYNPDHYRVRVWSWSHQQQQHSMSFHERKAARPAIISASAPPN